MSDTVLSPDLKPTNGSHRHRHRHPRPSGAPANLSESGVQGLRYVGDVNGFYNSSGLYDQPRVNPRGDGSDVGLTFDPHGSNMTSLSVRAKPHDVTNDIYESASRVYGLDVKNATSSNLNISQRSNRTEHSALYSYFDPSSNQNGPDDFEYQQYDIVPFNTDEDSESPHFDAEFFPEPVTNLHLDFNETASSLPSSNPFQYTPWGAHFNNSAANNHPIGYNSSIGPANLSPNQSFTGTVFDTGRVRLDFDSILTGVNTTSVFGSGFNSSAGEPTSSGDLYTWSILIMAPLVIFGIAGNTLVILAISLEKRLQNVTNYFLLSLAVTDLLVSLIVMPFSIINVFTGRWLFGFVLCDFFVTSDVLMCTSSILHMCTISLERYIGIRYPLWTKNKSKRIVLLKIVLVWTIALAITSPITVLGIVKADNVLFQGACVLNNEHFIIYGSICAFFIPLAIMVLMYALTVKMLNTQARLCQSRGAEDGEGQPMIRRSTSRRNWQTRRQFYGREVLSVASSYSGTRNNEYDSAAGMNCPSIHQRYRPLGINRHNTIPLCHHYHHHSRHQYHHHHHGNQDGSPRIEQAGSGGGGGPGSNVGSNNSINSLHRGRNSSNNNSAGANNNNSNNAGGNVESSSLNTATSNNNNILRRGRYSTQNGRTGPNYVLRSSPPDYPYCNGHQEEMTSDVTSDSRNCCTSSSSSSSPSSSTREPKRLRELVRKHHVAVKAANILLMKREGQQTLTQGQIPTPSSSAYASVRRDNSVRTEQKASKVLGVVFMIFVVCWAPFFTVNILTALCTSCRFEPTLITAFVWLGYVSSTLNPIIYTIFNNIFRITFIKLLCCRYRLLHRARRNSNMPGLRNGLMGCSAFCPAPLTPNVTSNTTNTTIIDESNC
ncbi:unnamed protein product [Lymnaea stagnalis]|uniref:G-protein coupled receptors family 1 profile domain-containing protein n=1 Tax=Lymnaea stagnalis TaxID=6523 RepID=A0AAV2HZF9_LYMST